MEKKQKPVVLVTGANGQLGWSLQQLSALYPAFQFVFFQRTEWAIEDYDQGETIFQQYKPSYCINCAAYTAVDKAESEEEFQKAMLINGIAPAHLAKLSEQYHCVLVHFSTDYVFDGMGIHPYTIEEVTKPVNAYGKTKESGERAVLEQSKKAFVIRTSWVFSPHGHNFVKTMVRLMREKPNLKVVEDQKGCPTYAPDLAQAVLHLLQFLENNPETPGGLLHFCNKGATTWKDFASAIAQEINTSCLVEGIPTSAYPTPAKRPAYSVLDTSTFEKNFSMPIRPWQEALHDCISQLELGTASIN
jgi:dTDP-4-dehydrorhamnose reductase